MSCPVQVTLEVNSTAGIHVQLTWAETYGDMDLHYIGPGGSFYEQTPYVGDLDWMQSLASAVGPVTPTPNCGGGIGVTCARSSPTGAELRALRPITRPTMTPPWTWISAGAAGRRASPTRIRSMGRSRSPSTTTAYPGEDPTGRSAGPATPTIKVFVRGVLTWTGTMPGMKDDQGVGCCGHRRHEQR